MTKEEARRQIIQEWDEWISREYPPGHKARAVDGLIFLGYLSKERSHLLSFKAKGDLRQAVYSWLVSAGKIAD